MIFNPISWLNDKLQEFLALPPEYDAAYETARQIFVAEAQLRFAQGRTTQNQREIDALYLMRDIDTMRKQHRDVMKKLRFADSDTLQGLPVVIGVVAVSAAVVVVAVTSLLRRIVPLRMAIQALENSGATPEEILRALQMTGEEKTAMEKITGNVSMMLVAVLGIGVAGMALGIINPRDFRR